MCVVCFRFFFFFQAADGIRDATVTGVQTCALPICAPGIFCVAERMLFPVAFAFYTAENYRIIFAFVFPCSASKSVISANRGQYTTMFIWKRHYAILLP